jgi:ParB-like chromosome segregation protein Spo0J
MRVEVARLTVREPFKSLFPVEPDVVEALTADMKANGFDAAQSIFVWKAPDGELVMVDGHMRLLAAKAARLKEVHATIRRFADEDEAFAFAIKVQRVRRNLTKLQIAEAITRAETARASTVQPIARSRIREGSGSRSLRGSTSDPITSAVIEKAAKKGISKRTAQQALANVRAENGTVPKPRRKPKARADVIPVDESAAPSPAVAKHLPYPPHLHRLLEALAKLTTPADLHILVEHATYACLDLAEDEDAALKAVRGAVSTGARNHRNFDRLVEQTVGPSRKGQR